ncbi:hypothetical protein RI845_06890 [Thalassotalea nanhaiensis]|uniref:Big-1 domain-containing protein n=1 Tax=Thalassotalea nanhaiensis TaxID=3065648 RepID=A0ABY9TQ40_9GAMM|nr:hypothetical protein RI845_06890 [Colwelliaceae bacterium SQ345]
MKQLRNFFYLLSLILIVGCDGDSFSGKDDDTTPPDTVVETTIELSIDNQSIDIDNPATISATVKTDGSPVSGVVVAFSSDLGLFDVPSSSALTNSDGVAIIGLTAGPTAGAGTVTGTVSVDGSDYSGTVGFETSGEQDTMITLSLKLVAPGTTDELDVINATTPGQIIATVNGIDSPVIVTFTTDIGELPIPTAITNDEHNAIANIYAGNELGAGTVKATLSSGETGEVLIVVGATDILMGITEDSSFTEGKAGLTLSEITAGATSVVYVEIVDADGLPYTQPVDVEFSSVCSNAGFAALSSPVTSSNGIASSTYLAQGCSGDDPITVSANAGGINLNASTTLSVLPASSGSIQFVSATPENISLKGVGGQESSTVVFKVLDTNGNPVPNIDVAFALNTEVGGITMTPEVATTDAFGLAQTVVNSGTVATTVRVTAGVLIDGQPEIYSQSSLLVISTGIPDQDSFSLSADILNPEGWDVDGNTVNVTARLADAFNNPVPDGTAIAFTTEGGSIEPYCQTIGGACSVQWTSQQPRPEGILLGDNDPTIVNELGQKYGGRATILAIAIGEESFPDLNGNGRFDTSEFAAFGGNDVSGRPYDLEEAFVDHNEDRIYNPQDDTGEVGGENEVFADFNNNGIHDAPDGVYNGSLCAEDNTNCSATKSVNVRGELVLVMSGSSANFVRQSTFDASEDDLLNIDDDDVVNITGENTGGASVIIADLHNQPMPAGTVIEFTATAGSIVGPDTFTWPNDNHNGGLSFGVSIEGEDEPKSGTLIISVTTPAGVNTTYSGISIVIGAATPPAP